VNSEELELSLRNEFESYLKNVLAEMKQEVSDFQEKFQAEFDKHKSQLDDVFKSFAERIDSDRELDDAFKDSVVEHLRLSRDEGARITASAIAEAEDLEKEKPAPAPAIGFSEMKDAILDISSQDSQSAILKSLVNNAAQFTARGAFFIIKNEHFVGWRVFGQEAEMDEQAVRDIFFPMANETLLSESVRSLSAVESSFGTYADDSLYLNKLEFGQPEKMYAIPLIARGRGVAVLYADYGTEGADVNVEAIETLVRVAGLTVELLAASQGSKTHRDENQSYYAEEPAPSDEFAGQTEVEAPANYQAVGGYDFAQPEETAEVNADETTAEFAEEPSQEFAAHENPYAEFEEASEPVEAEPVEAELVSNEFEYKPVEDMEPEVHEVEETVAPEVEETEPAKDYGFASEEETKTVEEAKEEVAEKEEYRPNYSWDQPIPSFEKPSEPFPAHAEDSFAATEEKAEVAEDFADAPTNDFAFESTQPFTTEPVPFEENVPVAETSESNQWESNTFQESAYDSSRFETVETPVETQFDKFEQTNGNTENFVAAPVETVAETVAAPPVKSRFSDRNVDLPIEVAEDERRSHNDARRFARLLVSEIKLYNEQKVKEGREGSDLYDRLREAIDRSREMYDKRVQPPVASKFDYFHYELVSNLAEGDALKLGGSYPGATV
jgi:hypothetical protein